jgi:hypothetical protein
MFRSRRLRLLNFNSSSEVYPLKYCPSCNFTFPDFHHVCDFDGTELIGDPERPSLPSGSSRRSLLRRFLESSSFLAAVGLTAVIATALWIGYLDVVNQTKSMGKTQPSPSPYNQEVTVATNSSSSQPAATPARAAHNHLRAARGPAPASSNVPKARPQSASARVPRGLSQPAANGSEVAQRVSPPDTPHEKQPLFTAMLKTTWRVLKRPLRF